jgi:GntR family transcriptional regulator, transcriptional repressor for pyruvate dehydrogenase complex
VQPSDGDRQSPGLRVTRVRSAYVQVADQIRERIVLSELKPGERLPPEAELCSLFGVSRSTVREALRTLASQGLIETARGPAGGSFVAQPTAGQIETYLERTVMLMAGTPSLSIQDLLDTRTLLETTAVRLAADRRTEEQLALIIATTAVDPASNTPYELLHPNRQFHDLLFEATANPLLQGMIRPLYRVSRARFRRTDAPAAFWQRILRDHREIATAIANRQARIAESLMEAHMNYLAETYLAAANTRGQDEDLPREPPPRTYAVISNGD